MESVDQEQVREMFLQGFDCGQAVLCAVRERLGMEEVQAKKLAASFGGGMFAGETCGAVCGALIAIGLRYGHSLPDTPEQKNACIMKTVEFHERFCEALGSTVCRELLGLDVSTPEGMKEAGEKGLLLDYCPKACETAIRILEELL